MSAGASPGSDFFGPYGILPSTWRHAKLGAPVELTVLASREDAVDQLVRSSLERIGFPPVRVWGQEWSKEGGIWIGERNVQLDRARLRQLRIVGAAIIGVTALAAVVIRELLFSTLYGNINGILAFLFGIMIAMVAGVLCFFVGVRFHSDVIRVTAVRGPEDASDMRPYTLTLSGGHLASVNVASKTATGRQADWRHPADPLPGTALQDLADALKSAPLSP